jgi:magnesium-transporting ATPase (P-type)
MMFTGCVITAGRAVAVVTDTGMNTQMGKIAGLLQGEKQAKTPLQLRLDQIGKTIVWIAVISALFLLAMGLHGGAEFGTMIMVAIALAVAAVPETLALIVTLTLTNGVQKMVKKNALIRKLPAVETLGSASVICSDKTGTLTQNRMTVKQLWICREKPFAADSEFTQEQRLFLEIFAMAGNASVQIDENGNKKYIGSATEVGIFRFLDEKDCCEIAKHDYPRVAEIPFSSDRKKMTVILKDEIEGGYIVLTAGALDRLPLCPESVAADMEMALRVHDEFAEKALRVIALAGKRIDILPDNEHLEELEQNIKLMGLVGLIDPPRPEAAVAIQEAHKAGVHTVMITGDHAATAEAIAKELGIIEEGKHLMTGSRLSEMCDIE